MGKICKKCEEEFENKFRYCPLCGNHLKDKNINEEKILTRIFQQLIVRGTGYSTAQVEMLYDLEWDQYEKLFKKLSKLKQFIPKLCEKMKEESKTKKKIKKQTK